MGLNPASVTSVTQVSQQNATLEKRRKSLWLRLLQQLRSRVSQVSLAKEGPFLFFLSFFLEFYVVFNGNA